METNSILRSFGKAAIWILILVAAVRCSSYSSRMSNVRGQFERGEYDSAISSLSEFAKDDGNDQLLYLMDLGVVAHTAGRYKEAIDAFLKADKLAEIKDYTSISAEAASVLVNDDVKPYKGEDFEKLLINVYLAIDYTMLGQWDDALVECRKVNHKLDLLIRKGDLPYEHNSFAKYLSAVLFEARNELNDAMVDYRTVNKWKSGYPYLPQPLLRIADRMKMSQEYDDFRKQYPSTKNYKIKKNEGEIVLLLEQGRSPVKVESEQFRLVPRFQSRYYTSDSAFLRVGKERAKTYPLYDIEQAAIKELDDRIALIATKKIGGLVAKEAVAQVIANQTKSEAAGMLARVLLFATDHADLRSWSTLPAKLHVARLVVPAGRHNVAVDMVFRSGSETAGMKVWENVEVKPGQKVFLNYRTPE